MTHRLPPIAGDVAAESAAVRHSAGVIDRSDHGVLEVTGRDRAAFLHAMLSNDVTALAPGEGREAALLDVHGKVQALLVVRALEDRILVRTPPGLAPNVLELLDKHLFSEKAYLRDATGEFTLLMLAGPDAPALAERLTGSLPPPAAWSHVVAKLDGIDLRLVRGSGETGEAEIWFVGAASDRARLWQATVDGGARPIGVAAYESLRIEAGTPRYGQDVDTTTLLPEIPTERLVSQTKGCYLGQEVVVRIRDRGHVNRLLRGLVFDGDAVPVPGATLMAAGSEVGRVTSAAWSYTLKRPIALGYVRRSHAEPGTRLTASSGEQVREATVSALPFPR